MIPLPTEARAVLRVIGIVLAVAAILAVALFLRSCGVAPADRKTAVARVDQAKAETTVAAARDATAITGNTMDTAAAIDRQTEKNHDAILSGDGSDDVALRALCMRSAYRNQPRCAGMLKPGAVPAIR